MKINSASGNLAPGNPAQPSTSPSTTKNGGFKLINVVGIGLAASLVALQIGLAVYLRIQQRTALTTPQFLPVEAIATLPDGRRIVLEVARTDVEKIRGLRFRDELSNRQGLLFQVNPLIEGEQSKFNTPNPIQEERGKEEREGSRGEGTGISFASKQVDLWLDNVHHPLDIVFLKDNRVVQIVHAAPPCVSTEDNQSSCPIYSSSIPIDQVLELKSNSTLNLSIGSEIYIQYLR